MQAETPQADPSTDPVDVWVTCLGCQAEREPNDPDRDCACVLGGYDAPGGEGILNHDHDGEWVRASTLPDNIMRPEALGEPGQ